MTIAIVFPGQGSQSQGMQADLTADYPVVEETAQASEVLGISVICAATAEPYGGADDIRNKLSAQVYSPVLLARTVEATIARGAASIIECGPGTVLAGLVRRINKGTSVGSLDNLDNLQKALQG